MSSQGRIRREMEKEVELRVLRADYPKLQKRVVVLEAHVSNLQKAIVYHETRIQRIDYRFIGGWIRKWRDRRMIARKMAEREEAARRAAAEQEARQAAATQAGMDPPMSTTLPGGA